VTYTGQKRRDSDLSEALRSPAKYNDVWFQIIECVGDGKAVPCMEKESILKKSGAMLN